MEDITIRKAKKEDYQEVIRLYGLFVENKTRYQDHDNDSFNKVIDDSNTFLEVACIGEKTVAFIVYSIRNVVRYPKPIIEVEEFFVLEEFRRKRIGQKLMDRVFAIAKEKQCEYVFLASSKDRIAAHNFYKNYGFDEYAFHYRKRP
ncbi:hypothetical protein COY95_05305 [Candidatus Woesearchaeota archaeon CG_4_10_14_0_8_um_filter_47_5]|nr:MAG: hypothetical protein COY95_05305 [Candidatus Woesearchaeota archaeon CG_4_10_14_0_8_um_filter_47_5]